MPRSAPPDNIKRAGYEPVVEETCAEPLDRRGVWRFPARVIKPRDKGLVGYSELHNEGWILAPRNKVFHDLACMNRAIAARVGKIDSRSNADGAGQNQGDELRERHRQGPRTAHGAV